eukprot:SAG22_NODE_3199_length_1861_cov_1.425085_1_plen_85_part_10
MGGNAAAAGSSVGLTACIRLISSAFDGLPVIMGTANLDMLWLAEFTGLQTQRFTLSNYIIQIVSTPPVDLVNVRCEVITFHYTII